MPETKEYKEVLIVVNGGVAEVTEVPEGVRVVIQDHDNKEQWVWNEQIDSYELVPCEYSTAIYEHTS